MTNDLLLELILGLETFELVLGPYFTLRLGDRRFYGLDLSSSKARERSLMFRAGDASRAYRSDYVDNGGCRRGAA